MTAAQRVRLRVARHFLGRLPVSNRHWDLGDGTRALEAFQEEWPQARALYGWLRERADEDPSAAALASEYPIVARQILREFLAPAEWIDWTERTVELTRGDPRSAAHVTALCELALCAQEIGEPQRAVEAAGLARTRADAIDDARLLSDVFFAEGVALQASGRDQEAVHSLGESLERRRALLGDAHPEVLEVLNGLAYSWHDLGQPKLIVDALQAAIQTYEAEGRREHTRLAESYRLLGGALSSCGEYQRAEHCCARALEIDVCLLPRDHRFVAVDLNDLGLVCWDAGKLKEAEDCFQRALAIDERWYGEEHSYAAARLNNLGALWLDQGQPQRARKALERSLQIVRATYPGPHPNTAAVLGHLGRCQLALGDPEAAALALHEALEIRRSLQDEEHPKFREDLESLQRALAQSAPQG